MQLNESLLITFGMEMVVFRLTKVSSNCKSQHNMTNEIDNFLNNLTSDRTPIKKAGFKIF